VSLDVVWLSVFADVPVARFERSLAFWEHVTASRVGATTGERGEYTPLIPPDGDRFFWLQAVQRDDGGWHPDLHVTDVAAGTRYAVELGGRLVRESPNLVVLATPAGQPFCLVREDDPEPRRRPITPEFPAGRSLADQLCLDIPADRYDLEIDFWAELTGWRRAPAGLPEFRRLNPPGALPMQFLLQRLGTDDAAGARAHLDMAADDPDAEVSRHRALGAEIVQPAEGWTTLRDPAGLTYCVTRRRPGEPAR